MGTTGKPGQRKQLGRGRAWSSIFTGTVPTQLRGPGTWGVGALSREGARPWMTCWGPRWRGWGTRRLRKTKGDAAGGRGGGGASMGALIIRLGTWRGLALGWAPAFWVTQPSDDHESYSPTLEKHVHLCQVLNIGSRGSDSQTAHNMPGAWGESVPSPTCPPSWTDTTIKRQLPGI